ncbi:MAG: N-acetylglucosaminyldiphosphoundecaprenol N-acetyl-beta-D-mannosaminyltransferase [Thermoleophilaceae bacterium]|nr:N-acetylglucosaminyldiphosphoundecaprenol N-acetyl-beta-D-mannosaminyltransferase [Thermoleophilaceae bacterium]
MLGCPVDRVTLDQATAILERALEEHRFISQFSVNAAKVVTIRQDPQIAAIAGRAELITADGSSVVLASRLFGDPLPERVTGIDLMYRLFGVAERRGLGVYLLGATAEVLELAKANLLELHPGLRLAGSHDGYFDVEDDGGIRAAITASGADILLVAMGSPRTELWIDARARGLGVSVALGVGGSVDVLAGKVKRAPEAFQRMHLEWLYRLAQEPRRLIRRNLVSVTFWRLALAERLSRTRGR